MELITTVPHYLVREQNFLEAGRIKLPRRVMLQELTPRVVNTLPCVVLIVAIRSVRKNIPLK